MKYATIALAVLCVVLAVKIYIDRSISSRQNNRIMREIYDLREAKEEPPEYEYSPDFYDQPRVNLEEARIADELSSINRNLMLYGRHR